MKLTFSLPLFILLNIIATNFLYAAPISNYPVELSQPDGTKIECFMSGDEYFNYYHTAEGFFIKQGADGFYYFADKPSNKIIVTPFRAGTVEPGNLNIKKWLSPNQDEIRDLVNKNNAIPKRNFKKNINSLESKKVTMNNLVIFVKFKNDSEYNDETKFYDSIYNDEANISFRNFYHEVSYNNLDVITYFYPTPSSTIISVTDDFERDYYSEYNQTANPDGYQDYSEKFMRELTLLTNALTKAAKSIPANLDFDGDDNGKVDNVTFIIKGQPNGWNSLLWPHRSYYYDNFEINGSSVGDYNFALSDLTRHPGYGLGTICHEFFHTLGSPDLYHYNQDNIPTVGRWDLMEMTSNPPQHMCNFLKWQYTDWISEIPEITEEGKYTLYPNTSQTGSIYKLMSKNSEKEYFILEYRKKTGNYESVLPGSGLLVYRINTELDRKGNGEGAPDEIYLYRPDGNINSVGNISYANLNKEDGRTSIGEFTNPQLFHTNGETGGIEILNVSDCSDSITFEINFTPRTNIVFPFNKSIDHLLNPVVIWRKISKAASYTLEISDDIDFVHKILNLQNYTDTTYQIPTELKRGTKYYARVKWSGNGTVSAWSDINSFYTIQDKTVLIDPPDVSNEVSILPAFKWKQNINTSYYRLEISEVQDFAKIITSKNFIKDTVLHIANSLKLNTKYYWRIKSTSLEGNITNSDVFSFITKEKDIVIKSASVSADVCEGDSVGIKISVAGSKAGFQWFFNNEKLAGYSDSVLTVTNFAKSNAGKYYCEVKAVDFEDLLVSSEISLNLIKFENFGDLPKYVSSKTDSNAILKFELTNNFADFPSDFSFQWFKGDSTLPEGKKYNGTKSLKLTIFTSTTNDIDSTYRLRIITKCGDTVFTYPYYLTVGVENMNSDVNGFSIYPNPASGNFMLNIPAEMIDISNIKLEIFDYLGRKAGDILSQPANNTFKGNLALRCDVSTIPQGVYILVITNGTNKKAMSLILN